MAASAGIDALGHLMRPAAAAPQGALVLMHGRGTDEHDLFAVLDFLDPKRQLTGVTVRAPLSLPPGGQHWYRFMRVGYPEPHSFLETYRTLDAWLGALEQETGVGPGRTVLGGFSQGGVMAYALGLGAGRPSPAGVLAMSSFLPRVENFELDLSTRRGLPVAIAHGTLDPVIPVEMGQEARDILTQAGLDVTYRESAMAHTIDPRVVPDLQRWLSETIATAGSRATSTTSSAAEGGA